MPPPLLYDTHMHTPLCRHATGEPEAYAQVAHRRGLAGIVMTCHNPMPDGFAAGVRMAPEEFGEYVGIVDRARQAWQGRVDVRLGLECDFMPGFESWLARQIDSADLQYVLGSVHPFTFEYESAFDTDDPVAFQRTYFEQLALAAETGLFDCLSHPDLVKNANPDAWKIDRILDSIRACLDRVARTGLAMELNTSGWYKSLPEANPAPAILREMRRRDIPVVIGSDAHSPDRVGDLFEKAMALLEEAGYSQISFFIKRKRRDIQIDQARKSLSRG